MNGAKGGNAPCLFRYEGQSCRENPCEQVRAGMVAMSLLVSVDFRPLF